MLRLDTDRAAVAARREDVADLLEHPDVILIATTPTNRLGRDEPPASVLELVLYTQRTRAPRTIRPGREDQGIAAPRRAGHKSTLSTRDLPSVGRSVDGGLDRTVGRDKREVNVQLGIVVFNVDVTASDARLRWAELAG